MRRHLHSVTVEVLQWRRYSGDVSLVLKWRCYCGHLTGTVIVRVKMTKNCQRSIPIEMWFCFVVLFQDQYGQDILLLTGTFMLTGLSWQLPSGHFLVEAVAAELSWQREKWGFQWTSCLTDRTMASFHWPPYWSVQFFVLLTFLLPRCWTQIGNQFERCRSRRNSGVGSEWKFSACQPPATNMKEFMQIRVDPPGITCGNPPERFCTLVSQTHNSVLIAEGTPENTIEPKC